MLFVFVVGMTGYELFFLSNWFSVN